MWKAILVLFMTSNTQPMAMMVGQFPETFVDKAACQSFLVSNDGEIDGTVKLFTRFAERDHKVLDHKLQCVEDKRGVPA